MSADEVVHVGHGLRAVAEPMDRARDHVVEEMTRGDRHLALGALMLELNVRSTTMTA